MSNTKAMYTPALPTDHGRGFTLTFVGVGVVIGIALFAVLKMRTERASRK